MSAEKKNVKVALTFDFDTCCLWVGTLGATSPSMISPGEFGPKACRRILEMLDRFGVQPRSLCLAIPRSPFPSPPG